MSSAPQIRYCTTADGVRIAYWTMGTGPPLVLSPPMPFSHIAAELDLDDARAWYERMAQTHTLVRYDPRGCGSSQVDGADISMEGFAADLDAVTRALPFESYAVVGGGTWAHATILLASSVPERVSHLILWDGYARSSDYQPSGRVVAMRSLIEKDWAGYTDAWAQTVFGWANASQARAWSRVYRACTGPADTVRRMEVLFGSDVSHVLPRVDSAVLVIAHGTAPHQQNASRYLAASLANARLVLMDGPPSPPAVQPDRVEQNARVIDEFIGVPLPDRRVAEAEAPVRQSATAAAIVLFTDIVSSTELTERMGDTAFRGASRALDAALRTAIRAAGGAAIDGKLLGDGVLATFPSAAQAIDGARRCLALSAASELGLHIGLHAGDVIREEGNVFGGAVNIASRICGLSAPGEILVSDVVRGMARSSAGVVFEDRGEQEMKGVGEPVRVYAVRGPE